jgi:hypothetical protein
MTGGQFNIKKPRHFGEVSYKVADLKGAKS